MVFEFFEKKIKITDMKGFSTEIFFSVTFFRVNIRAFTCKVYIVIFNSVLELKNYSRVKVFFSLAQEIKTNFRLFDGKI